MSRPSLSSPFALVLLCLLPKCLPAAAPPASKPGGPAPDAPHSVWVEAEYLGPIQGANFSFQQVEATTKGTWSLAGPGVAAEWTQGGESEFLSIAARADEPGEVVTGREVEIPAAGAYTLWVRYADYRKKNEAFGVRVKQGDKVVSHVFGTKPLVDELDPLALIWDWSFAWGSAAVPLAKGPARVELYTTGPTDARRHVDCICLTTDPAYSPAGREKPDSPTWRLLREMRDARIKGDPAAAGSAAGAATGSAPAKPVEIPAAWKIGEKPPAFVWNVNTPWMEELKRPDGIQFPFGVDPPLLKEFTEAYRGKSAPVYSHPLSGASWHIPQYPAVFAEGSPFLPWLARNPDRRFVILLNYGQPNFPEGANRQAVYANLQKHRGQFAGYIAGESIAHEGWDNAAFEAKIKAAKTRADLLAAFKQVHTDSVVKKFSGYYGQNLTPEQAWADVISCLSANNEAYAHALGALGCRRIGHENTGNSPTLARRLAFLRGAARQFGAKLADYQSANLGDSATMFSREAYFYGASSRYIMDNSYDGWAGAGVNWLLKDYLLFHLAGNDVFYNEQGVDLFWKPGGHAAGDNAPVQLSAKGKVAEAITTLAGKHPRGTQYTPVAFLLDEAHGYSQERFEPGSFSHHPHLNPALLTPGKHEAGIRGWFDVAYFPAPLTQNEPASGVRQTFVNGIFGDIFDVIVTAPGKSDILKTYPVAIAAGEVPLSEQWGAALKAYVEGGGTLVVTTDQLTGPGAAALALPAPGAEGEAAAFEWKPAPRTVASNVFRFRALPADGGTVLATAGGGEGAPAAVSYKRGNGQVIAVGVPLGLGVDSRPVPLLALVMDHVTTGLLPVTVAGDVEVVYNRLDDGGWLVSLLNNRGVIKPQHGVLPTDTREAQAVKLSVPFKVAKSAEWMSDAAVAWEDRQGGGATATVNVPAGAVRLIAIHPAP